MSKKIISIFVVITILFVSTTIVSAENIENSIQPRYKYTSTVSSGLTIKNGIAYCSADVSGYTTTTKIKITMTLQRRGVLFWNEVDTWTTTYYDSEALMSKSYSVSSGKYRVKNDFTVYSGSNSEEITVISPEKQV